MIENGRTLVIASFPNRDFEIVALELGVVAAAVAISDIRLGRYKCVWHSDVESRRIWPLLPYIEYQLSNIMHSLVGAGWLAASVHI